MNHLAYLLRQAFPNRFHKIYECYFVDEVGNQDKEYHLYVEDIIDKTFPNFQRIEKVVEKLYTEEMGRKCL